MQESRIQLSGFDAYKQKKREDRNFAIKEDKTAETIVVQSEIAYDEPPQDEQKVAEPQPVNQEILTQCWLEFSHTAGVRASSLMKAITPLLQGSEVVVTIASAAQQDAIEDVQMDFIRFVSQKTRGAIQSLRIEKGAAEITDRKPYTEKEKLEFMLSKNPEWKEMIEKLGLRLP